MSFSSYYPVTEIWYFHFILTPEVWCSDGIRIKFADKFYDFTLDKLDKLHWLDNPDKIGWSNYTIRPTVFYYKTRIVVRDSFPDTKGVDYQYIRDCYLAKLQFLACSYRDIYDLIPPS